MNNIINALNRRYATKKFDTNKKVKQTDLDILFEALRLSPSSSGLQPWKFIHIKNPETRKQLQINSRGQPQITEASDLLVIAAKENLQANDIEEYIQNMKEARTNDEEKLIKHKNKIVEMIASRTSEQLKQRNQKQAYIAMGILLTTCASMGIDACPMEGFDPQKYNEILGLDKLGLTATVVIPLGYRSSEDKYANLAKVRYAKEKLIIQK